MIGSKPFCVVVDDDQNSLSLIQDAINEIGSLTVERVFSDPERFLIDLDNLEARIIFLDIEMPGLSGIDLASKLGERQIIFISGRTDLAVKTYDVEAVDFVPKPLRLSRLKQAIDRLLKALNFDIITIRTDRANKEEIDLSTVVYVSPSNLDSRDKNFHFIDGSFATGKDIRINHLMKEFPKYMVQINRGEIVNVNYVTSLINRDTLGIKINGALKEMNLGDSYRDNLFSQKENLRPIQET